MIPARPDHAARLSLPGCSAARPCLPRSALAACAAARRLPSEAPA